MVNSSDFSKRLHQILDYYNLSATAFAEELQLNRSTISHLISGRNKPSLEFVMKVIQRFSEVELYWLLNGKGSFPSKNKSNPKTSLPRNVSENSEPIPHLSSLSEDSQVDRIVIFYKNGTFKEYKSQKD